MTRSCDALAVRSADLPCCLGRVRVLGVVILWNWRDPLQRLPSIRWAVRRLQVDGPVALLSINRCPQLEIQPPIARRRFGVAPRRGLAVQSVLLKIGDSQTRSVVTKPQARKKVPDNPTSGRIVIEIDEPFW
jgi:hypothetical protein